MEIVSISVVVGVTVIYIIFTLDDKIKNRKGQEQKRIMWVLLEKEQVLPVSVGCISALQGSDLSSPVQVIQPYPLRWCCKHALKSAHPFPPAL